jgi:hypothetical protein
MLASLSFVPTGTAQKIALGGNPNDERTFASGSSVSGGRRGRREAEAGAEAGAAGLAWCTSERGFRTQHPNLDQQLASSLRFAFHRRRRSLRRHRSLQLPAVPAGSSARSRSYNRKDEDGCWRGWRGWRGPRRTRARSRSSGCACPHPCRYAGAYRRCRGGPRAGSAWRAP